MHLSPFSRRSLLIDEREHTSRAEVGHPRSGPRRLTFSKKTNAVAGTPLQEENKTSKPTAIRRRTDHLVLGGIGEALCVGKRAEGEKIEGAPSPPLTPPLKDCHLTHAFNSREAEQNIFEEANSWA